MIALRLGHHLDSHLVIYMINHHVTGDFCGRVTGSCICGEVSQLSAVNEPVTEICVHRAGEVMHVRHCLTELLALCCTPLLCKGLMTPICVAVLN